MSKVCVVIVTYNGAQWIRGCLKSLSNSSIKAEIIIVDNCSTDETKSIIRGEFPDVVLKENETNLGFGQANNEGICLALKRQSDYVFLLNQDTAVEHNTIAELVRAFEVSTVEFGILSPIHYNDSRAELDSGFLNYIRKDLPATVLATITASRPEVLHVKFVNAAAWLVKASMFEKVGGFAPLFFHYGEDRDFVNRLVYRNLKIGIVPSSAIIHYRNLRNMNVDTWPHEKRVRYYSVGWISRAANIEYSLSKGFYSGMTWVLKETTVAMAKGNLDSLKLFFNVLTNVTRQIAAIKKHRIDSRSNNPRQFLPCV